MLKKLKTTDKRITKKEVEIEPTLSNFNKIYVNNFSEIPNDISYIIADIHGKNYSSIKINALIFSNGKDAYYLNFNKDDQCLIDYLCDESKKKNVYDSKSLIIALKKHEIELKGIEFDLLLST